MCSASAYPFSGATPSSCGRGRSVKGFEPRPPRLGPRLSLRLLTLCLLSWQPCGVAQEGLVQEHSMVHGHDHAHIMHAHARAKRRIQGGSCRQSATKGRGESSPCRVIPDQNILDLSLELPGLSLQPGPFPHEPVPQRPAQSSHITTVNLYRLEVDWLSEIGEIGPATQTPRALSSAPLHTCQGA